MKKKPCRHPEKSREPGVFWKLAGSFMTLGPRREEKQHVIDWCSECGAIRFRENNEAKWSPWRSPVRSVTPTAAPAAGART